MSSYVTIFYFNVQICNRSFLNLHFKFYVVIKVTEFKLLMFDEDSFTNFWSYLYIYILTYLCIVRYNIYKMG